MIIGIDLGTTNSCVSVWRNNKFEIIPDKYGNTTIPSIVAFTKISKYVGHSAKNQTEINPLNTFYEIKRLIGRKITEICDMEFYNYEICCNENGNILVKSEYGIHTPEEISSLILLELKQMATIYLGEDITDAVITVPAYFTDVQRQATKDAAIIAGLNIIRIINEPTAAALAYGFGNINDKNILVYDFGGGTLDISVLNINNGLFEVIGSSGNTRLGGTDFDNKLISYCLCDYNINDISPLSLQNLKYACEKAKKLLSNVKKTSIIVKNFYNGQDFIKDITRNFFDELCGDLYMNCLDPISELLNSCKLSKNEIDDIILVGGSTRMPKIRENLSNYFKKDPNHYVNPDEIVAMGASIMGYILSNKNDPFSQSITLMDVTTLSLGVETLDGIMDIIIPRNTTIPTTKQKIYTTISDNETSVSINIYEGERKLVKDNLFLGSFELTGLEPMPRGYAKISVIFKIDSSGIIEITAEDMRDGNANYVKVMSNKNNLDQEKINELIEKAKYYENIDKKESTIKILRYELLDIIRAIRYNLSLSNMNDSDKNKIINHINSIDIRNDTIDEDFLKNNIDILREKYFGLCSIINNDIKPHSTDNIGTNIYNDEKDDNCEIYQANKDKIISNNEDIKNNLINYCINILDNLSIAKLEKDKEDEIKYILDDIILWAYVDYNINKNEYNDKLNYVTELYNNLFSDKKNILTELENMCYELLINNNNDKTINEILEWIIDCKAKLYVKLINNIDEEEYKKYYDILKNNYF